MKSRIIVGVSLWTFFACFVCFSASVDTVQTFSPSMKKNIKAVVLTPDGYSANRKYPVVYLLHGYSDNYSAWVTKAKGVDKWCDEYGIIVVCPDGGTSWYLDCPEKKKWTYETYVSGELVRWIDERYSTIRDRNGRGIAGLSMGGHGALYLAFRHPDVYGAAGSMSGGVDFRPFPENWSLNDILGKYADHSDNWEQNTVINLVHLLTPGMLALFIDCGTEDFFFDVNQALHKKLNECRIPHDYMTRPGAHDWNYWTVSVQYQMLFFNRFFTQE